MWQARAVADRLTLIGYWLGPHAPDWPDVREFVDPSWDLDERLDVADYLRRGRAVAHFMGYSECRFCGELNGTSDYTDGTYIWPEGLGHYILKHDVRLPPAIVDHIVARLAHEPELPSREDADTDWWRGQGRTQ